MSLAARLAASAASGATVALAFPPYGWWPLLVPALVVLLAVLWDQRPRRAALLGLAFGLAQMLVLLPWVRVIGPDAWVVLSLLEALFFAGFGWAVVRVQRLAWWPVAVAALWVLLELGRSEVPFTGFPWGRLAFATVDTPLAGYVRWIGVPALSGLVVLIAALVWWAVLHRKARAAALAALVGAAGLGAAGLVLPVGIAGEVGTVDVAAVQGGVPGTGADGISEQREVVDNHEAATLQYASDVADGTADPADVVMWPENSTDIDPFADPATGDAIQRSVDAVGVPLLVGALTAGSDDDHLRNVGMVWRPQQGADEQMYVKRNLVPFGEYIPMRDLLAPMIGRLDEIPRDFEAGDEPGVLDLGPVVIGDAMCYDVAFEGVVAPSVRDGAELLVVQTNNATYLGTGQPDQQWAISRLRAMEAGRDLVVASTNGISGFVAADGSVLSRSHSADPQVLTATVRRATGLTWGVRFGGLLQWLLAGLAVAALVVAGWSARRERLRSRDTGGEPAAELEPVRGGR